MLHHPTAADPMLRPIETPAAIVDLDAVERNLKRSADYFAAHGIAVRPHIKTHKSVRLAQRQIELGAVGITCQKLGEAEIMADAGIQDILLSFPIIGSTKVGRLAKLARAPGRCISTAVDSPEGVWGIAEEAGRARVQVNVLVECDVGGARCGVQTPEAAADLASMVADVESLVFRGLMVYPPMGQVTVTREWLTAALLAVRRRGLRPELVSVGGTPDMFQAHQLALRELDVVQEHRPGTYIFNDRYMADIGVAGPDDCALRIQATVVSRPTQNRAIIDAGSKTLSSDLSGFSDYGAILEYPAASLAKLSEEHGHLDLSSCVDKPGIGECITIIPNHACAVTNLFDSFIGVRTGGVAERLVVDARGRVA